MLTKTYLRSNLCESSDSCDSCYSSEGSDSSDSGDKSDQTTFFIKKLFAPKENYDERKTQLCWYSKTQIVMKLKNSNCDKTEIVTKLKLWRNSHCNYTQIVTTQPMKKLQNLQNSKLKMWQLKLWEKKPSKTQIVTKLKNSNYENLNYDKSQFMTRREKNMKRVF